MTDSAACVLIKKGSRYNYQSCQVIENAGDLLEEGVQMAGPAAEKVGEVAADLAEAAPGFCEQVCR